MAEDPGRVLTGAGLPAGIGMDNDNEFDLDLDFYFSPEKSASSTNTTKLDSPYFRVFRLVRRDTGISDFPGGKVEIGLGDRSVWQTAVREFREELGAGRLWHDAVSRAGSETSAHVQEVPTPSGSVHYVYFWVVALPPLSVMDEPDCEPRLLEPDKHREGGFAKIPEVLAEIAQHTSQSYADGAGRAIDYWLRNHTEKSWD